MGREVRRVPPNWEHPKSETRPDVFQPMLDEPYASAAQTWERDCILWSRGEHPDQVKDDVPDFFWEREGQPPTEAYYRPHWPKGSATWFQLYETVSEGTPVTPPFATTAELIDYLVENGDYWCQSDIGTQRRKPSREAATALVEAGWAPSMMIIGGRILDPAESALENK